MNRATPSLDANTVRQWVITYVSSVLEIPQENVSASTSFAAVGLDSVEAVLMAGVMEEDFGIQIEPSMIFDDPSIEGLIAAFRRAGLVTT